jgi:hypothetical protein
MNLKKEFIELIELKSKSDFKINNKILYATLNEAIEFVGNQKLMSKLISENEDRDFVMTLIFEQWASTTKTLIETVNPNINFKFKNVELPKSQEDKTLIIDELSNFEKLFNK